MRFSAEDIKLLPQHIQDDVAKQLGHSPPTATQTSSKVKARGRTRPPVAGRMNNLERSYATHLETLKLAGEVASYQFQAIKLRLADRTWYTPDFNVVRPDGALWMVEVKGGHWEDDARVKIKVAAEQHPYTFVAVQLVGKSGWREEFFAT